MKTSGREVGGKPILLWQSVWDDAASADRFAAAYRQIAGKRTNRSVRVDRNTVGTMNGVWIVDAPSGTDVSAVRPVAVQLQ